MANECDSAGPHGARSGSVIFLQKIVGKKTEHPRWILPTVALSTIDSFAPRRRSTAVPSYSRKFLLVFHRRRSNVAREQVNEGNISARCGQVQQMSAVLTVPTLTEAFRDVRSQGDIAWRLMDINKSENINTWTAVPGQTQFHYF